MPVTQITNDSVECSTAKKVDSLTINSTHSQNDICKNVKRNQVSPVQLDSIPQASLIDSELDTSKCNDFTSVKISSKSVHRKRRIKNHCQLM